MQPSLEKLRKFFRLEHENKYNNTAIIGGLEKMLDFWEGEARNDAIPEEIIQAVASRLRDYNRLSPSSRAETLKGLWNRINKELGIQPEKPQKAASAQKTAPDQPEAPPELQETTAQTAPPKPEDRPQKPGRARAHPSGVVSENPAELSAPLTVLQGIGSSNAKALAKLGMHTLGDMLYNFPRRYDDYSLLKPIKDLSYGEQVTVIGTVKSVFTRPIRGGKSSLTEMVLTDGTGSLRLSWFNQAWMANRHKVDDAISVSGKIEQYLGRLVLNNPNTDPVEIASLNTNRIVPIYSLTENITQNWLRKKMISVISYWAPRVIDPMPETILDAVDLPDLGNALLQVHLPESQEALQAGRKRLAFDEIFFLQMGVLQQKMDWQKAEARTFEISDEWLSTRIEALPFTLTGVQTRAVTDIRKDLASGNPMNRLLQGDVGSGKTVVAGLAIAMIAESKAQSALMAPTSILAEQHHRSLSELLTRHGLPEEAIRLLVGDTPEAEKESIRNGLADGSILVVIGTHALIEDPVQFADLQLAIIDEQHRFGVDQRAALRNKGTIPHLLVMTATPIPRSLALTLYGDLELSIMDEMPIGRQPIGTHVLRPQERERAYSLIKSQVESGYQAFIVYPLIEESEKSDKPAAVAEHARLQESVFINQKLGLLHGRMRPDEKEAVMSAFRDREFDILVSTTVVEVGVDVPNATVMLIEGANHFGLAQLHQLRGRVGRGAAQSYCLLIPEHADAAENERLQAMEETNDGFILAERDLKQRGPGEFLGTRQSGHVTSLRMASLTDIHLIETARDQAQIIFDNDPDLTTPENKLLKEGLLHFWGNKGDLS